MKSNCQKNDVMHRSAVEEILKNQEIQFQLQLKQQYEYFDQILKKLNKENRESPTFCKNNRVQNKISDQFYQRFNKFEEESDVLRNRQNNIQLTESSENDHNFRDNVKKQLEIIQNSVNSSTSTKGPCDNNPSNAETKLLIGSLDNCAINDLSFNQTCDTISKENKNRTQQPVIKRNIQKNCTLNPKRFSKCKKPKTSRKYKQQLQHDK